MLESQEVGTRKTRIFRGMLSPISFVLLALSATSPVASEPTPSDSEARIGAVVVPMEAAADPAPSSRGPRAEPATQFLYSSLGGGLGILGGGFVGGAVAAALSSESDGWAAIGNVIIGVGFGVLVGGTTGATWGAVAARPPQKDRSFVPTALGSLGGLLLGYVAGIAAYDAVGSEDAASSSLCFVVLPALGAGAGATMVDQLTTPRRISGLPSNSNLGLTPWMPREGLVGLRLSLPTGI